MDEPLKQNDFDELEKNLRNAIEEDRKYWRVNEVKCDAVHTAKTYEEFSDRVAAAHLKPLEKKDAFQKDFKSQWNTVAK